MVPAMMLAFVFPQLGTCLMASVVAAVLSLVAVLLYSVDLFRNPEVPCVKLLYDTCDDHYYATVSTHSIEQWLDQNHFYN